MKGELVREIRMAELFQGGNPDEFFLTAKRAELQNLLLDALESLDEVLLCGVQITGFEQDEEKVTVSLSNGTKVHAAALFGCDGIHSTVRHQMFANTDDELSFAGQLAWWAQVRITPELEREIAKTQSFRDEGNSFVWALGTSKLPGSFMAAPTGENFVYAYFAAADEPTDRSSDLTRRGGIVLDESSKEELLALVAGGSPLMTTAIRLTAPEDITKAGIFNRANLDLPYTQGRVALLGDAAHPQSPFMGQGANMSIVDAYVLCTRCTKQPIAAAIAAYDTAHRRNGVNAVVKGSRTYGQRFTSSSRVTCWIIRALTKFAPLSWAMGDLLSADKSNQEFVAQLDKDLAAMLQHHRSRL
mmetsp:Transcript_34731/g.80597  ORF Transcript_34731/g.80597 Transcript_34731/m.80597 type:complete len:358 (-) Transcript_34731:157-1230(-)